MSAFQALKLTAVSSCKLKLVATQNDVLGHAVTAEGKMLGPSRLLCYEEAGQAAGLHNCGGELPKVIYGNTLRLSVKKSMYSSMSGK